MRRLSGLEEVFKDIDHMMANSEAHRGCDKISCFTSVINSQWTIGGQRRKLRQVGKPYASRFRPHPHDLGRHAEFQRLYLGILYDRDCVVNLNRDGRPPPRQGLGNSLGSEKYLREYLRDFAPYGRFFGPTTPKSFEKLELSTINVFSTT
jgi:hypothetical protein